MPEAENLETVRTFFDRVLNAGDFASLETFFARDVAVPQSAPGVDGLRRFLLEMRTAFSDPEYKVMDAVADGEKVVVRFSGRATHSGRYLGLPATGKSLRLWGVMVFRFECGAIAEFWNVIDAQGVLGQLRGP